MIGGALYFEASHSSSVSIQNSLFSANSAIDSGAVFADNTNLTVNNSQFISNSAVNSFHGLENRGGAVTLLCSNADCNYTFQASTFQDNTAEQKGGAVYWEGSRPDIGADTVFIRNTAEYGRNVASYAVKVVSLNGTSIVNVPSGQPITEALYCALLDHYGNIVSIDNSASADITSNWNATSISGHHKVTALQGVFLFQDFVITATPLETVKVNVTVMRSGTIEWYVELNVSMRDCRIGESLANSQCQICPAGKYSLNPRLDCQKCPEGAECLGNYTMVPKPGYWRSSNLSDVFFACPNPNACLGSTNFSSPTGLCDIGYEGNKCQQCSAGYSHFSKLYCFPCLNEYINGVKITGFLLLFLVLALFIVHFAIKSANQSQSVLSIYLKVLMNYVQLTMLMSALNLNWPNMMLQLFQVHDASGSMIDEIISIDCLLSSQSETSAYFIKLYLMASIPILLLALSVLVWLTVALVKRNRSVLRNECVSTIVTLFFIFHPSIVRMMFSIFNCEEIDPGVYWVVGLNIKCWESAHLRYTLALALPCILVWGLGIPTIILLILRVNRNKLKHHSIKVRFGFLFSSYDAQKYYWEFVVLYRKLIIIFVTLLFAHVSVSTQALTVLGILLLALLLQFRMCPYAQEHLNQLELRCIWVSIITIDCGLFYYSGMISDAAKVLFLVVIIAANVYFLFLWFRLTCWILIKQMLLKRRICRKWFPHMTQSTILRSPVKSHRFSRTDLLTGLYLKQIRGNEPK